MAPNVLVCPFFVLWKIFSKISVTNSHSTLLAACHETMNQVLTSAHCINAIPQKIVTLGMHKIKQDDSSEFYKIEHIPIAESVVHPNFDTSTADNDFWIIRLQWASKLYSGNVAQLDTPTDTLVLSSTSGADLVVIGFGRSVPWEPAAVM